MPEIRNRLPTFDEVRRVRSLCQSCWARPLTLGYDLRNRCSFARRGRRWTYSCSSTSELPIPFQYSLCLTHWLVVYFCNGKDQKMSSTSGSTCSSTRISVARTSRTSGRVGEPSARTGRSTTSMRGGAVPYTVRSSSPLSPPRRVVAQQLLAGEIQAARRIWKKSVGPSIVQTRCLHHWLLETLLPPPLPPSPTLALRHRQRRTCIA